MSRSKLWRAPSGECSRAGGRCARRDLQTEGKFAVRPLEKGDAAMGYNAESGICVVGA